jgi:high-affinity nickel-transport protein
MPIDSLPHGLTSLAIVVLLLGIKHGFDADHLATIDGLTRASAATHPRWARACGALFSLGHGAVVVAVALAVSHAAASWQVPGWLNTFGAWVSISFLIALGLMNLASVWLTPAHEVVSLKGLRHWLFRRARGGSGAPAAGHPVWALPIGALFAVSFDTVSQAAMFSATASRAGAWQGALFCALVFTLGMLVTDGINGLWISRLLRRGGSTARIASRAMGTAVGLASLLVAALGIARMASGTAGEWLDERELLLGVLVIAIVLTGSLFAARLGTGPRSKVETIDR